MSVEKNPDPDNFGLENIISVPSPNLIKDPNLSELQDIKIGKEGKQQWIILCSQPELGRGAFGIVYKCHKEGNDQEVFACKIIPRIKT